MENGSGAEDNGDSSHCSNASTHSNPEAGPSTKRTKTSDDSGLELETSSAAVPMDPVLDGASEIELVFRPHPTLMEKDDSAQTRLGTEGPPALLCSPEVTPAPLGIGGHTQPWSGLTPGGDWGIFHLNFFSAQFMPTPGWPSLELSAVSPQSIEIWCEQVGRVLFFIGSLHTYSGSFPLGGILLVWFGDQT